MELRAAIHKRQSQYEKELVDRQHIVALSGAPCAKGALRNLAECFAANGKFDRAAETYKQLLEQEKEPKPDDRVARASALQKANDWDGAAKEYELTLRLCPTHSEAQMGLAGTSSWLSSRRLTFSHSCCVCSVCAPFGKVRAGAGRVHTSFRFGPNAACSVQPRFGVGAVVC